jgi:hypothetical protein
MKCIKGIKNMKKYFVTFSLMLVCSLLIDARISSLESTPSMPESRCTVPKTAKTDLEFSCLKGNVHTVKSESAVFVKKDGQYVKVAVSAEQIVTYDKQGNMIERLSRGTKDYGTESNVNRVVYNFDSKGIATGWEEYNSGKQIPVKNIYTYDNKGKRIKQTVTYTEEQSILILVYDSKSNKVEERTYYPVPIISDSKQTDEFIEKYLYRFTKYKYDGKNLIQTTFYNKEGLITNKVLFTYENGNKKEVIAYSADAKGNLTDKYRTSFNYDGKGNMIEKIVYNKDDSIQNRYVNGFDEQGYRISGIIYDSTGKITSKGSIKYEFDSHGNWLSYTSDDIKSSERINAGEPFAGELRTITYY